MKKMGDIFEMPFDICKTDISDMDGKEHNYLELAINMRDDFIKCLQDELEFLQDSISQPTLKDDVFCGIAERIVEVGGLLERCK